MSFTQTITDVINFADKADKNNTTTDRSNWEAYLANLPDEELRIRETFM